MTSEVKMSAESDEAQRFFKAHPFEIKVDQNAINLAKLGGLIIQEHLMIPTGYEDLGSKMQAAAKKHQKMLEWNAATVEGFRISPKEVQLYEEHYPRVNLSYIDVIEQPGFPSVDIPPEVAEIYHAAMKSGSFNRFICRGFGVPCDGSREPVQGRYSANLSQTDGSNEGVLIAVRYSMYGIDYEGVEYYLLAQWGASKETAERTIDQIWYAQKVERETVARKAATCGRKHLSFWAAGVLVLFFTWTFFGIMPAWLAAVVTVVAGFASMLVLPVFTWAQEVVGDGSNQMDQRDFLRDFPDPKSISFSNSAAA